MYECEEQKKWQKEHPKELALCCHCKMFMHEADACLEDSMFTPLMYKLGKKTKPCHFVDNGSKGKARIISINTERTNSVKRD